MTDDPARITSLAGRVRPPDAEAIVVGGGPAGSTVAALLAEAGHRVVLLDKAGFPRHKACSDYLTPAGVEILCAFGIEQAVLAAGAQRIDAMLVHAPSGRTFRADFGKAESGRFALGLSRLRLDHLLLERARASGVTVCEHAHVRAVARHGGSVVGVEATVDGLRETIRAPLVIGADGRYSAVTRSLGLDVPVRWPHRTGLVAHFRGVSGLDRRGELHVTAHGYVGLAPIEDGLTNVAVVADAAAVSRREESLEAFFTAALRRVPAVAEKLSGAERVGGIRGIGPLARRVRRVTGDGFLLVGDAAGFLDPFTGDGIFDALLGAQLAAPVASAALGAGSVTAADLAPYRAARRRAFFARRHVRSIVQGFIHVPVLMDYATVRLDHREDLGLTLSGVLGNFRPARQALSPLFLARLLRP
jgi:geranylgeranyl reductase family protein